MYFRVIFFIPVILAGVIMSYLFNDGVGSISVFGSIVGSASGGFFGTLTQYIGNIMWSSSVEILIFLAALQSVPDILYEVVEIDGATAMGILLACYAPVYFAVCHFELRLRFGRLFCQV